MAKIATCPDSWGVWFADTPNQVPWSRFLDEVVESGYNAIELGPYGYLPTDVESLRRELDRRGLSVIGANVMNGHLEDPAHWPQIENKVLRTGELLASLGAEILALWDDCYCDLSSGKHVGPTQLDDSGWSRLIETTQRVAEIARDRFGLRFAFHPHCETHVETEEQIELLLEQTDPDLVFLCLDTGHHVYSAGDPVAFMREHHKRIIYLHLKTLDGEKLARVKAEKIPMVEACKLGAFCEQPDGIVDFRALTGVLRDVGFEGWATVEQGLFQPPHDYPLPVARRAREYFREIGMG